MADEIVVHRFKNSNGSVEDALLRVEGGKIVPDDVEFAPVNNGGSSAKDRGVVESRKSCLPFAFVNKTHPSFEAHEKTQRGEEFKAQLKKRSPRSSPIL